MSEGNSNNKNESAEVSVDFCVKIVDEVREEFLRDKSVQNAIRILERMVATPVDSIDVDNSEYWPEICDLLSTLLKAVPVEVMLAEHQIVILSLLNKAPERFVTQIAHDYFRPAAATHRRLFQRDALAVLVATARRVGGALCADAVAGFLCHFVDVPEVMKELNAQLDGEVDAEKRFRVYQVALSAMCLPDFENYAAIRPLVNALVDEVDEERVLTAITALEMLAEATNARRANAAHLASIGVLDKTYAILRSSADNPDGGLIHTACIRFFGYLSHTEPNALVRYEHFTRETFDMTYHFDLLDATRRHLAFETLAIITTTSEAKQYLASAASPHNIRKAMNHFGVAIAHSPDDLRVRLLGALRLMMSAAETRADAHTLRDWFAELGAPFPTVLLHFLRKPFDDVRVATLELLVVLFSEQHRDWALPLCNRVNGFMDQLLDRTPGNSAQVWQLKFDVVRSLAGAAPVEGVEDALNARLKHYLQGGVYRAETEQSVDWGNL